MTPLQRPSRVAQRTSPLTGTLNFAAVITTTPPGAPCPPAPARRRRSVLFSCLSDYRSSSLSLSSFCRLARFPRGHRSRATPDSSHAFFFKSINTAYKCAKGRLLSGAANMEGSARSTWPFWLDSVTIISDARLFFFCSDNKNKLKKGVCEEKLKQPGVRVQRGCSPLMAELRIRRLANLIPVLQRLWVTHTKHKKTRWQTKSSTHTHRWTDVMYFLLFRSSQTHTNRLYASRSIYWCNKTLIYT